MKKIWCLQLFVAAFFSVTSVAVFASDVRHCPPTATLPTQAVMAQYLAQKHERGFLWKITKNNHSSWLYGTIHIAKIEWDFPGPLVLNALTHSQIIGLELNLAQKNVLQDLRAPQSDEVRAWLEQTGRQKMIEEEAEKQCIDVSKMKNIPLVLQAAYVMTSSVREEKLYANYGLDLFLTGFAGGAHRPIFAFENARIQRDILVSNNKEETGKRIDKFIKEIRSGKARAEMLRLANAWDTSNSAEMEKTLAEEMGKETDSVQELGKIYQRNENIANTLAKLHEDGKSVFAGVGALHMFGEKGLPALMKARGYKVEQIVPAVH